MSLGDWATVSLEDWATVSLGDWAMKSLEDWVTVSLGDWAIVYSGVLGYFSGLLGIVFTAEFLVSFS